jgi:hypothetical protein
MNKKAIATIAISLLFIVACVTVPKVVNIVQTSQPAKVVEGTSTSLPVPASTNQMPTWEPTDTPTVTTDPCVAYLNTLNEIISKFEAGLVKTKTDMQNGDGNEVSWDKSQLLDFAYDDLSVLVPPPQFEKYQSDFLYEITVYQKGATAYLQADHAKGAAIFLEGDGLDAIRKGTAIPTCK